MKTLKKLFFFSLIPIIGWGCSKSMGAESDAKSEKASLPSYRTMTINVGTVENGIIITGRVIPTQKVDIIAEVQGTSLPIKNSFEEGNAFRKGELMIAIDDRKFEANLYAQKSRFLSALVRIMSDLKIDYPNEYPTWDGYLSSLQVVKPLPDLPNVENDQLRYFLAANSIYDQYYSIVSQEETLRDHQIYAPFSGAVTMAMVDPGDLIRAGVKLGEFTRTDLYEVRSSVSIADLDYLQIGQEIELHNRATNRTYQGTVHRFGKNVDSSTQAVAVFIRVGGDGLKEGMYLEGRLKSGSFQDVAEIPQEVLTRENQVYSITNNVVKLKFVSPVQYREETVLVKGLANGDLIITETVQTPLEGTRATSK